MNKYTCAASVMSSVILICVILGLPTAMAEMQCISVTSDGTTGSRDSYQASISDDGRYIAFRSNATNLVAGDANELSDVFVYDTQTGTIERVSVETGGGQFNGSSFAPSISNGGRYVAMQSYHSYTGSAYGGYGYAKIIVYDRHTDTSTHILPLYGSDPTDREARQEPAISGNGQFVAFHSYVNMHSALPESARPVQDDNNRANDIYVYDLINQTTDRVSRDSNGVEGNGDSFSAALSDNGRFVTFYSYASNLVVNDTNDAEDIFVKDRMTGRTTRASVAGDGTEGNDDSYNPTISGDGRYVTFRSLASNLVDGDTNGVWDIFVHDRDADQDGIFDEPGAAETIRVSVADDRTQANGPSYSPSISDDGRYLVFRSDAANLVNNDTNKRWDIFLHDRNLGTTKRINLPTIGEANIHSYSPVISGDGKFVAFESDATNLTAKDTNASKDVFLINLGQ